MNIRNLFGRRLKSNDEIAATRHKLEEVTGDDERVARLERRVSRIMRENNLAPVIIKALRAGQ